MAFNARTPHIIGSTPKLSQDQIAVIDVCKETLAQALAGEITSIAIVACMKSGYATVMSGRQASDLFMGAGSLQRKILSAVEKSGEEVVRQINPESIM
jgi:hypothetical protein